MYLFSDAFLTGEIAFTVPQQYFDEFLESCIAAEIPDSEDEYTKKYAYDRYKEGLEIFAHVAYGDYLCLWRDTDNARSEFEVDHDLPIIEWHEAVTQQHIRKEEAIDLADFMELL